MKESKTDIVNQGLFKLGYTSEECLEVVSGLLEENGAPVSHFAAKNGKWLRRVVGSVDIEKFRSDKNAVEIGEDDYNDRCEKRDMEEMGLL